MAGKSRITSDIDFQLNGRQESFLRIPHSVHRSAYGWIGVPIVVIKNGSGPTVLLTSGNHGDEYDGQIALMKLCGSLATDDVNGRLIILPAVNFPAVVAGTRTSPIDDGNLNRSFPGDPDGRPTSAIAHYVESELLSMSDVSVDLHSGGSSLMYVPSVLARRVSDPDLVSRQSQLLDAFGAPVCYIVDGGFDDRTMLAATQRAGVAAIGTELGGGGTTSLETLSVAEKGVRGVLESLGCVPTSDDGTPPAAPARRMEVRNSDYFVYSPDEGIWEPLVELGEEVTKGQPAARVYDPKTPWHTPVLAHFSHHGTVICKRVPGAVVRGDCLYHLATDVEA